MGLATPAVTAILRAAAAAPSGDNSQPWRFVVRPSTALGTGGFTIEFYYMPELDHPLLNAEEGGTLIALGAAVENARLEALAQGYAPHLTYPESGPVVARMELAEGNGALPRDLTPLREAILRRHSNRKAYRPEPLEAAARESLIRAAAQEGDNTIHLVLIEEPEAMRLAARALTTMEEIALGNEALHRLFFESISWSARDNAAGKKGLYIKTLELPPPAQILFPLLKRWRVAKLLARLGFPQKVAEQNAKQNASASAIGILTASATSRHTYLKVGRALERMWLTAAARGYQMQIVTGLPFLARALKQPEVARLFTEAERARIKHAYAELRTHAGGDEPLLLFRIGRGAPPAAVSGRRAPEVAFA